MTVVEYALLDVLFFPYQRYRAVCQIKRRLRMAKGGHGKTDSLASGEKKPFYRHELKFYLNYVDYVSVRQSLRHLLEPDENADENGDYIIRSLYFDDFGDTALTKKIAGVDDRNKYRVRIYNFSPDVIKLEKKIKNNGYIRKDSITLSKREYDAIIAREPEFLLRRKEPLAHEVYLQIKQNMLEPRVIVDYTREAYVMDYERVRITFDKDLKSTSIAGSIFDPDLPCIPMLDRGMVVLEVKFGKYLPDYIKGVLWTIESPRRSAISKYTICRKYD